MESIVAVNMGPKFLQEIAFPLFVYAHMLSVAPLPILCQAGQYILLLSIALKPNQQDASLLSSDNKHRYSTIMY
jgi:hypothetical protein